MQAILHLGTYKTGSSSLQNMLYDNRAYLLEHGILYPEAGLIMERHIGIRHTGLIFDYLSNKETPLPKALAKEISDIHPQTILFSSEAWSNPGHLSHLSYFAEQLKEIGIRQLSGFAFLRNIAQYKISLYREFTVNQKNTFTYPEFTKKIKGLFNILYITQAFQSIFQDSLILKPFDHASDIRPLVFDLYDLKAAYQVLRPTELANVKKVDAVDVEAIRCANQLKIHPDIALDVARSLKASENGSWTEFSAHESDHVSDSYKKTFKGISNWGHDDVEALFHVQPPIGDPITQLTPKIMAGILKAVTKK